MSEYGDKHRSSEKKAKVARYTRDDDGALDASGYRTPGKPEEVGKNTYVKQPVPRAYKCGGAVAGEKAKHHSGRKARSAGGAPGQPDVATNQPEVPNNRFSFSNSPNGVKSMTGIKRGGEVKSEERKARAHGGETTKKVKGKTNINIIISAGSKDKDQQPQSNPMGGPVKPPSPPSPPPMSGSPPPMGPMPPPMGGMPPGGMPPGGLPPGPMPGGGLPPGHPGLPPGRMGR